MAGAWKLVKGNKLSVSDIIRDRRTYDGETHETNSGDRWANGMPEILERWYVADWTRNGWVTLAQERVTRYGGIFKETGVVRKVRTTVLRRTPFLLAIGDSHQDAVAAEDAEAPQRDQPASIAPLAALVAFAAEDQSPKGNRVARPAWLCRVSAEHQNAGREAIRVIDTGTSMVDACAECAAAPQVKARVESVDAITRRGTVMGRPRSGGLDILWDGTEHLDRGVPLTAVRLVTEADLTKERAELGYAIGDHVTVTTLPDDQAQGVILNGAVMDSSGTRLKVSEVGSNRCRLIHTTFLDPYIPEP